MTVTVEVRGLEQLKRDLARLAAGGTGPFGEQRGDGWRADRGRHAQGGSRRG